MQDFARRCPLDRLRHLCLLSAGLFVAMLAIGGGWGRLVGMAVQGLAGGVAGAPPVSLPAYTVVGAAAMLGAHISAAQKEPADQNLKVCPWRAPSVFIRQSGIRFTSLISTKSGCYGYVWGCAGGVTRMTVSITVLVMEATGGLQVTQ